jgi:hypothetical protein
MNCVRRVVVDEPYGHAKELQVHCHYTVKLLTGEYNEK